MNFDYSLDRLEQDHHPALLIRCISGSRAYGTHHARSDTDIRGIYMLPMKAYLSLKEPPVQVSDKKGDTVYYSLRRLLNLAAQANPNILELLYTPEDCQLFVHPIATALFEKRHLFLTQKVQDTYIGYAKAQIKKASGQNKWVNRPQPQELPERETFCWVLPQSGQAEMGQEPLPLKRVVSDVSQCFLTKIDHFPGMHRLHKTSSRGYGVFRNGKIFCQPHMNQAENRSYVGLMFYNESAYEAAKRDHKNYWHWVKHRNQKRWETQEAGVIDYDAKNMMHTFRLLLSGAHILEEGAPLVRFEGEKLAFLKNILAGQFQFKELCERADALINEVQMGKFPKRLSPNIATETVDQILRDLTERWEREVEDNHR